MNKILGIFGLLIFVCLFTTLLNPSFVSEYNLQNITRWSALFGILSIGVAFVVITGGIDLSIGSVVGLVACLLPMMVDRNVSPMAAVVGVILVAGLIGLIHGVLITRLDLPPFVVTLCGLLVYRGLARWITDDNTLGFGQEYDNSLRLLAIGKPCSWATMLVIIGASLTVYGIWKSRRFDVDRFRGDATARRIFRWSVPLIGFALLVIGSTRFWFGFESAPGPVLFEMFGYQIRGVLVSVPDSSEYLPRVCLWYVGIYTFVPISLLFVFYGLAGDRRKVLFPVIAVFVTSLLLSGCVGWLGPLFREISPDDTWQVGVAQISGGTLKTALMLVAFVTVGTAIAAIGWLLSSASSASEKSKALLPMLVASGVMALAGQTNLMGTMVPMPVLFLIGLSIVASILLNQTVFGRYLLALGQNEQAARYSGIATKRMTVVAYVLCSLAAGLGGVLFALDVNSVQPAGFGEFYELYAIAAAVLGGCSLRGGEGNILGVVIGAAVMRVLYNSINILGISTKLEFAIIGVVILAGAIVDVVVKRMVAKRAVLESEKSRAGDS